MSHRNDNRVLVRMGARELNAKEVETVNGGVRTLTACTSDEGGFKDGDASIGEC